MAIVMSPKGPYHKLKYFLISMVALAILACIAPFFLKGPDDRALLSPDQIRLPDIKLPGSKEIDSRPAAGTTPASSSKKQNIIYRWKDPQGVVHFTDYPNPNGPSEILYHAPEAPADKASPPTAATGHQEKVEADDQPIGNMIFPLTPGNITKLKQEADRKSVV